MLLALYPLVIELPTNKQWQKTIGCSINVHGETFAGSMLTEQAAQRNMTGLGAFELKTGGENRVLY